MYKYVNGTSQAAPHVTGVAALLKAAYPDATPSQIKAALLDGANRDKNPVVYPYASGIARDMKKDTAHVDSQIEAGIVPAVSRDALLDEYRVSLEERDAKYKPLDGTGRISRTGLLDVKAAYDLLGERLKAQESSSSSGGCSAGYPIAAMCIAAAACAFILKS